MTSTKGACSVCGHRTPVYLRTYSGEALCIICLERALIKSIKRAIGITGALKPREPVLVPITLASPSYSLALARLVSIVERKFGSKVIIAVPEPLAADTLELLPRDAEAVIAKLYLTQTELKAMSSFECLRLDRRWSIQAARHLGVKAVALPFTRTELLLIALEALFNGDKEALTDSSLRFTVGDVVAFNALALVEAEAVAAYAYLKGYLGIGPLCPIRLQSKIAFYSIATRRPELEFSGYKTLGILLERAYRDGRICAACGGLSTSRYGEFCSYCSRLGEVKVEILSP
ncbi:MAG: hypothetical protein F7B95_02560 [Desulfurococcales archaeon]|nr:hypothetical protein [Desulfurococcales archaeon]